MEETKRALRPELPPPPLRIRKLPVDKRGYPVPYFAFSVNGEPDHRIRDQRKFVRCVRENRCWICGEPLGKFLAFLIGPMCTINRISAEPPSHRECAEWAVRGGCPFLSNPKQHRREAGRPEDAWVSEAAIIRNPGVTVLWMTKSYQPIKGIEEIVFALGDPIKTLWYTEGRLATRAEAEAAIETGCPILLQRAEEEGPHAVEVLHQMREAMRPLLPAA